jgi:hypothetical protein
MICNMMYKVSTDFGYRLVLRGLTTAIKTINYSWKLKHTINSGIYDSRYRSNITSNFGIYSLDNIIQPYEKHQELISV